MKINLSNLKFPKNQQSGAFVVISEGFCFFPEIFLVFFNLHTNPGIESAALGRTPGQMELGMPKGRVSFYSSVDAVGVM